MARLPNDLGETEVARITLMRPWGPEDSKLLADLAAQGMTLARIALRMKRKQASIAAHARLLGIELRRPRRAPASERALPR